MDKAYDILLNTEIYASDAAINGNIERYRYECACCGEEVTLAAAGSFSMIPHFRHRWENNGKDCENYLGNSNGLNLGIGSRRSKKDNIDFYFNSRTKLFYIGIKYTEQMISEHENSNSFLNISNAQNGKAFCSKSINREYFAPDVTEKIQLCEFSNDYYVWNSLDNSRRIFECFKDGRPTFFKILGDDTVNFYAKLLKSDVLYVGTPYLMLMVGQGQHSTPAEIRELPMSVLQEISFSFDTMNRKFSAKIITITENTPDINAYWQSWGYSLKTPEFALPLWPPMAVSEENLITNQKDIFLKTSFDLQAHANINIHSKQIFLIGKSEERVYKIEVEPSVKIHKENADILISRENTIENRYKQMEVRTEFCEKFECAKVGYYFSFGSNGVEYLSEGRSIVLFARCAVKGYLSNYLIVEVLPKQQLKLESGKLLNDILKNYKVEEVYNQECTSLEPFSNDVKGYMIKCSRCEKINIAVKRYIREGKL